VVQGPPGANVTGEHVVITNTGRHAVALDGFVLHDAAPQRPHRFVFPAFLLPGASTVRVWTRKGSRDAENLYWGRARPVWNRTGDTATLLDTNGERVARAKYPERPGRSG
jgi:hypothetical protein